MCNNEESVQHQHLPIQLLLLLAKDLRMTTKYACSRASSLTRGPPSITRFAECQFCPVATNSHKDAIGIWRSRRCYDLLLWRLQWVFDEFRAQDAQRPSLGVAEFVPRTWCLKSLLHKAEYNRLWVAIHSMSCNAMHHKYPQVEFQHPCS